MTTTTKPASKAKPAAVKPLPEVVDAAQRKFKVRDREAARVHLQDPCLFEVPLGTARYLQDRRAHELAHIKWTPGDKPPGEYAKHFDVPEAYLQAAEDCRVNTLARRADVKLDWLSEPGAAPANIQLRLDSGDLASLTCYALARTGCAAESRLINRMYDTTPKGKAALRIAEELRRLCAEKSSIEHSARAAKRLKELFEAAELATKPPELKAGSLPFDGEAAAAVDLTDPDTLEAMLSSASTFIEYGLGRARFEDEPSKGRWGQLVIKEPPRFTPCNARVRGPAPRPCDSGVVPTRLHRYISDGMIFSQKRKYRMGGSVLVDMSGSMRLPFKTVADWLVGQPMATVAVYSGYDYHGDLVILARNGRRTNTCQTMPGSNVIDGPALRWLAQQPRPRFWVSDGHTTGIHDCGYGRSECRAICELFHIERVRRFCDLPEALGKLIAC